MIQDGQILKYLLLLPLLLLAACNVISPLAGPTPTPTDCGCSLKPTPTGGIGLPAVAGPAGPGGAAGTAVDPTAGAQGEWQTYTNKTYGFTFEFPAAYTGKDLGFCKARSPQTAPKGVFFALDLGSRTRLSLSKADQNLDEAVTAFKADPANKDIRFDQPTQRVVGGAPALTLPYRSGGTNRYGESTFFLKEGVLYRVDTGTPSACDVPALKLTELSAYAHLLDSFTFK